MEAEVHGENKQVLMSNSDSIVEAYVSIKTKGRRSVLLLLGPPRQLSNGVSVREQHIKVEGQRFRSYIQIEM
jgi:hypothetical protein